MDRNETRAKHQGLIRAIEERFDVAPSALAEAIGVAKTTLTRVMKPEDDAVLSFKTAKAIGDWLAERHVRLDFNDWTMTDDPGVRRELVERSFPTMRRSKPAADMLHPEQARREPVHHAAMSNLDQSSSADMPYIGFGDDHGPFSDENIPYGVTVRAPRRSGGGAASTWGSVRRPEWLLDAIDAYALTVQGNGMAPALRRGSLVHVRNDEDPVPGDLCVVRLTIGSAIAWTVAEFRERNGDVVTLHTYNPDKDYTLDLARYDDSIIGRITSVVFPYIPRL